MGWSDDIVTTYLDKDILLPAIGQGALGIECRSDDEELLDLLKVHNHEVAQCVTAERTFLSEMDGSCQVLSEVMQRLTVIVKLNLRD